MPLARLPLKPRLLQERLLYCRERVDWGVEWRSVVLSDESRFCLYVSDGTTCVRRKPDECHLPECIRPRHAGPTSVFTVCGAISYNSRSHLVFQQDKVNSARYIAQVGNPVLLSFLRQEGDVLFNRTAHVTYSRAHRYRDIQQSYSPSFQSLHLRHSSF